MSKVDKYIDEVNKIIDNTDWARILDKDYQEYLAARMVDAFKKVYGTPSVGAHNCVNDHGFAIVPAKIKAKNGNVYLGLLQICVEDSSEHYGTQFFLPDRGVLHQEELSEFERKSIIPYSYRPLVIIEGDSYTDLYF